VVTIERSQDVASYDQERVSSTSLSNLSKHVRMQHSKQWEAAKNGAHVVDETGGVVKAYNNGIGIDSPKMMQEMVRQGLLNPMVPITQNGFNRHFAAWLVEDNLPWTTGESPGLRRVFWYIKCKLELPSDTTVRQHVTLLYVELLRSVVNELTVGFMALDEGRDSRSGCRDWTRRLPTQGIYGLPSP
jgi:hypothetical protein